VKVVRPAIADAGSGAAREGLENRVETAEELEAA
jgi:hypothetical protein